MNRCKIYSMYIYYTILGDSMDVFLSRSLQVACAVLWLPPRSMKAALFSSHSAELLDLNCSARELRAIGPPDVLEQLMCAGVQVTWWHDDKMIWWFLLLLLLLVVVVGFRPFSQRAQGHGLRMQRVGGLLWSEAFGECHLFQGWASSGCGQKSDEICSCSCQTPTNLSRENRFIMMSIMWNSFMCLSRVVSRVFANFRKSLAIAQRSVRTFEVYSKRVPRPWKAQFHLCELTQCCGWVLCCFFRSSVDRISAAMCLKMCHECHIKHRQVMMHPNSKPWTSLWKIWPTITTQLRCFELAFARIGPNSDWKTLKWRNGRNMKKWFPFCWFFRVNRRPLLKSFARTSCWSTTLKWSVSWSNMVPWRTSQVSFESMFERNVWATKTWQKISY